MDPKAILWVEDNAADVYLIKRTVKAYRDDLQLCVVGDGEEALAFLCKASPFAAALTPALIGLDLGLPTMDGFQLLTTIRQLPAYQATPIVVLSAKPKEIEGGNCRALGASAYVEKSSTLTVYRNDLRAIIRDWFPMESR